MVSLQTRWQFWRGIHKHLIFRVVAVLWLIFGVISTLLPFFPAKWSENFYALNYLPKWHWYVWVIGILIIAVIAVFEGGYGQVGLLVSRLEDIEASKPKIKLSEPNAIHLEKVSQNYGDVHFDSVPFLMIQFVNQPGGPYPSAKANDVRATINYYHNPDGVHLLSISGRWSDSDQPSAINPLASKTHLLATTFGIGQAHNLDIAYRDAQTGKYFAWNNDNYEYPFFRCEKHLLEGDNFRVDIHLLGEWVDEHFSFNFRTTEAGFELD